MSASKTPARKPAAKDPLDTAAFSEALRALARRGVVRSYRKGTLLVQEGDQGDTLYIILEGRLRVYSTGANGRELTFGIYGPGEYLGEMSLDGGPRSASIETMQASSCAVVTRQTLLNHIAEHPEFALDLLSKVIRRVRATTLTAKQMALNDVYGRLVSLLNQLGIDQDDGVRIVPDRLTHREIASRLGCSREMVSRLAKDLEVGGYIDSVHGQIRLLRPLPARW